MKAKKIYRAAAYLRLSRDDIDGSRTESNSISSQRDMIFSFVGKQADMEIYDTYADDGWSGTNFDRPEFRRMMEDIQAGHVDCVIVKDLSRLGRDYIEAGRLIQKTFPAFCVRFIALTDHFDSLTADYNETSLVVPVKNFVNDSYARDISGKVRSHQKIKRENGEFIGAFAVYGYKKCAAHRNLLVPDAYAADIVRMIFAWKIDGYSNYAIAKKLNEWGVLSPMEYKKLRGEKFQTGFVTGIKTKWSAVAVKRILTNEDYIGTLVQGKEEKVNYKVKKSTKKPREEWTRVEGAHEAIIEKEDFEIAQELLQIDTRAGKGEEKAHLYAGILFCGDCGEPLMRRVNRYKGKERVSFTCPKKNKDRACSRHTISEEDLGRLLLMGIRQQISLFMDKNRVLARIGQMEMHFEEPAVYRREMERLRGERNKYLSLGAGLYADLKREIITEEDFKNFRAIYEQRAQALGEALCAQERMIKSLFLPDVTAESIRRRMESVIQLKELDRMTLVTFVKRVCVYGDKRVYVEFRHREVFSEVIRNGENFKKEN